MGTESLIEAEVKDEESLIHCCSATSSYLSSKLSTFVFEAQKEKEEKQSGGPFFSTVRHRGTMDSE